MADFTCVRLKDNPMEPGDSQKGAPVEASRNSPLGKISHGIIFEAWKGAMKR